MDKQYPEYPQQGRRKSRRYQSAALSATLSQSYGLATPTMPEPTASISAPNARERRRRERLTGPRSILHDGATCDNDLCDNPNIAADERLCTGPRGLSLCSRCYKRFKIERRRAREEQRDMTNGWKNPKQSRPKLRTASSKESHKLTDAVVYTRQPERAHQDIPLPVDETRTRRKANRYDEPPPNYEERREPAKEVEAHLTSLSSAKNSESLHNFPTSSVQDYGQRALRSPRKHRSRHDRDEKRHSRHSHARDTSTYDDAEFYKYGRWEENNDYRDRRCCCGSWSRRRKCAIFGSAAISIILLIIIIVLAVTLSRKDKFNYTPSSAKVNSTKAFASGGGTRKSVNDTDDGIGAGTDTYTYYQGDASNFPPKERWVSFKDMWENNYDTFKYSCGWLKRGDNNTPEMIQDIYNAIQDRANASLVDHRIILATIIQETNGCPLSPPTTSSGGTRNPGLMQSHNGHAYDAKHSRLSILLMVQDGTQGTEHGWGLVDNLNTYGNPYKAIRGYNSGYIPASGDLSEEAGATACYVSDIANRLTGWVRADSKCPDDVS